MLSQNHLGVEHSKTGKCFRFIFVMNLSNNISSMKSNRLTTILTSLSIDAGMHANRTVEHNCESCGQKEKVKSPT